LSIRKLVPVGAVIAALFSVSLFAGGSAAAKEKTVCPPRQHTKQWVITIDRRSDPSGRADDDSCSFAVPLMEQFLGRSHPSFEKRDSARIEMHFRDHKYIFDCEYFKPHADHGYKYGGECEDGYGLWVIARPKDPVS
jgi:hypothetical protein